MREQYEQRVLRQVSTSAALDAALTAMNKEYEASKRGHSGSITSDSSDADSFVSALDVCPPVQLLSETTE